MNKALDKAINPLELGEALLTAGVEELSRRWQASTNAIGRLVTGAERWQAVIRQMQAPINLAEILRARHIL
jgi:hypothetical protein